MLRRRYGDGGLYEASQFRTETCALPSMSGVSTPATSFEMTSPDGTTFSVHTSASDSLLFDVATFAERVEPVDIGGASGWVVTDELEEDTAQEVLSIIKKTYELSSFKAVFIKPEYDFEMLSAYLRESTKQFKSGEGQ